MTGHVERFRGSNWSVMFVSLAYSLGSLAAKIKWIEADNAKITSIPVGSKLRISLHRSNPDPFGD